MREGSWLVESLEQRMLLAVTPVTYALANSVTVPATVPISMDQASNPVLSNLTGSNNAPDAFLIDGGTAQTPVTVHVNGGGTFTYDGKAHGATGDVTGSDGVDLGPPVFTYNGSTDLPTNVGTYHVVATFAGNADYQAGSDDSVTIVINPAPLTISVANATRLYGTDNPAFTLNFTGFVNNETQAALTSLPAVATVATASSPIGKYPITLTGGGAANYVITLKNGTLAVTPATMTISIDSFTRIYGDPNPTFTGTVSGIVPGDNITVTFTSVARTSSAVGVYGIGPSFDDPNNRLSNYSFDISLGSLTVTKAPLEIIAQNNVMTYGGPLPIFATRYIGFVNGDLPVNLLKFPVTTLDVTPASPVGNYTIHVSGAIANNYDIDYIDGTLTVLPAPLTITPDDTSRLYGDPNPTFTGTFTGLANGDDISAFFTTPATQTSVVNYYPIIAHPLDPHGLLSNYTLTLNVGTLTLLRRPATITVDNAIRPYGQPNPKFTGSLGDVIGGDFAVTFTSFATAASNVGKYPIVPTVSDPLHRLSNYLFTITLGTLVVKPAALTVTPANAARTYGAPNPALTGTLDGLFAGDNITGTFSTLATPVSNVGNYAITAALNDPNGKLSNYAVTLNTGTLTVTPAALLVTPNDAARTYGAANPAFSGTVSGLLNGDDITTTYSTTATAASPVGAYAITAALHDPDSKLGNYTVTLDTGTLTVNPAPLTITANDASRAYGQANPSFSASYSGFVSNDGPASLATPVTFTTTATTDSNVGAYAIVPSGATSPDYTINFVNGTLTVTKATLVVTPDNVTRPFGTPNPQLTGSITGLLAGDNITATYSTTATQTSPPGNYPITATLTDPAGRLANYNVTLNTGTLTVATPSITCTAGAVCGAEHQPTFGVVAHFTDSDPLLKATDFNVTIKWGDGSTTSRAAVQSDGKGGWDVVVSHVYNDEGTYSLNVKVTDPFGGSSSISPKVVIGEEIQGTGKTLDATAGSSFSGTIATFVTFDDAPRNSTFTAVIDWGDGHTSTATVVKGKKNTYSVIAANTYATTGVYHPVITVTNLADQGAIQFTATVNVSKAKR